MGDTLALLLRPLLWRGLLFDKYQMAKNYETTPENIRRLCDLIGSQAAAAQAIGVDDRTIRKWLAGDRTPHQAYVMALELAAGKKSSKK